MTAEVGSGEFRVTMLGHADPLVCAAASAITQTALLGLANLAQSHPDDLECTITETEG